MKVLLVDWSMGMQICLMGHLTVVMFIHGMSYSNHIHFYGSLGFALQIMIQLNVA